ncbi:hypothetical protein [Streptomonospora alba]|uniref:hypothetical protein n=1 Tax=Streptomonospora alba TaxID=183763 RepID=UPI0012ED8545|nr:hypothetical protein [Streptomonospora alba]
MKRGQSLGFSALIVTLAAIVALAAIGYPWVAGIVATTGLTAIVSIFVTGQYQPVPVRIPKGVPHQPVQLPRQDVPDTPPPPQGPIE